LSNSALRQISISRHDKSALLALGIERCPFFYPFKKRGQ